MINLYLDNFFKPLNILVFLTYKQVFPKAILLRREAGAISYKSGRKGIFLFFFLLLSAVDCIICSNMFAAPP